MQYTLSLLAETYEGLAEKYRQDLRKLRLEEGDRSICRVTLTAHCLVTYHSRPPELRLECIDCGATFSLHDDLLTRPHGRSKM